MADIRGDHAPGSDRYTIAEALHRHVRANFFLILHMLDSLTFQPDLIKASGSLVDLFEGISSEV